MDERPGSDGPHDGYRTEFVGKIRHESARPADVAIGGGLKRRRSPGALFQVEGIDMAGAAGHEDHDDVAGSGLGGDGRAGDGLRGAGRQQHVAADGRGHVAEKHPAVQMGTPPEAGAGCIVDRAIFHSDPNN